MRHGNVASQSNFFGHRKVLSVENVRVAQWIVLYIRLPQLQRGSFGSSKDSRWIQNGSLSLGKAHCLMEDFQGRLSICKPWNESGFNSEVCLDSRTIGRKQKRILYDF